MKLNEQQMKIVNHKEGNCVVFAGAGAGKSTTIIQRTLELVKSGVPQKDILIITFTNASASDLKNKLHKMNLNNIDCGTYHSVCAKILLSHGIDISKKLQPWEIDNMFSRLVENKKVNTEDILSFISYQKNNGITYNDKFIEKDSLYSESELRLFFTEYENLKKSKKAYDFDDYLIECLKLYEDGLCDKTWDYLQVDENQDNNSIQCELLKYLCPKNNITLVGDEKQSLYSFRGAQPKLFLNAPNTLNAKVIHLNTNYRSCKNIVDISNNFANKYYSHYKFYKPAIANNNNVGNIEILDVFGKEDEARRVVNIIINKINNGANPKEIAVLYRNHSMIAPIEIMLRENGIEYEIDTNGSFFKQKQIEIVLSVLRLALNPEDNSAYEYLFKSRVGGFKYMKNIILEDIRKISKEYDISFLESINLVKVQQQWQKTKLMEIPNIIDMVINQYKAGIRLNIIISNIIKALKLHEYIEDNSKSDEDLESRLESLDTLLGFASGNSIENFLHYAYETSIQRKKDKKSNDNAIKLQTIHKSKGLEYDSVFLIGLFDGKFPNKKSTLEEECCCFYVGLTRAKKNLYISGNDGSQFFEDIKENLNVI